jgi:hypothetical protein
MNIEFIKSNYFELFLCIGLTTAGLFRLIFPELRHKEMIDLPINEIQEHILILYELSSIYIIFYTDTDTKNIYYSIYIIGCVLIALYYLSKRSISDIFSEFKELSIFPNDMKTIWYHLIIVFIFIYMIYIK